MVLRVVKSMDYCRRGQKRASVFGGHLHAASALSRSPVTSNRSTKGSKHLLVQYSSPVIRIPAESTIKISWFNSVVDRVTYPRYRKPHRRRNVEARNDCRPLPWEIGVGSFRCSREMLPFTSSVIMNKQNWQPEDGSVCHPF